MHQRAAGLERNLWVGAGGSGSKSTWMSSSAAERSPRCGRDRGDDYLLRSGDSILANGSGS